MRQSLFMIIIDFLLFGIAILCSVMLFAFHKKALNQLHQDVRSTLLFFIDIAILVSIVFVNLESIPLQLNETDCYYSYFSDWELKLRQGLRQTLTNLIFLYKSCQSSLADRGVALKGTFPNSGLSLGHRTRPWQRWNASFPKPQIYLVFWIWN